MRRVVNRSEEVIDVQAAKSKNHFGYILANTGDKRAVTFEPNTVIEQGTAFNKYFYKKVGGLEKQEILDKVKHNKNVYVFETKIEMLNWLNED